MTSASRSLADAIRSFDAAELAALIRRRPDLAQPRPRDLTELIDRLSSRSSTLLALDRLNAWQLLVAQAIAAWEGGESPLDPGALATAMALPDHGDEVRAAIDDLRQWGLAWGEPAHLTQAARAAFGDYPGGLAPASVTPLAPQRIAQALTGVGEAGRAVLDRLVWGPPTGAVQRADRVVSVDDAETTMDRLLAWGLLRPITTDQVILPREVALYLRSGALVNTTNQAPVSAQVPAWHPKQNSAGASLPDELIDRAAIGSAQELLSHVVAVVDDIAVRTPRSLANGGIPKREMTGFARLVENPELSEFVVALASQAGLFVSRGGTLMPTVALDGFLDRDGFGRWLWLRDAWRQLSWWPEDVAPGERTPAPSRGGPARGAAEGRTRAASPLDHRRHDGAAGQESGRSAWMRQAAYEELQAEPRGTGIDAESLAARLAWRHPASVGIDWSRVSEQLMAELEWLGLLAFARTTVLIDAGPGSDPGFTPYGHHIVLQSDLTAVAPAPLDHETAAIVAVMANRESHGATATYRFTAASVERAMDRGWSGSDIRTWLVEHSSPVSGSDDPLPAALASLIDDGARRHGRVRVTTLSAVVQLADPATEASLLADANAEELGLVALAPGVIGASAEPAELIGFLRQRGLAPVAQSTQGVQITTPATRRAPAPSRPSQPPAVDADALASALLRRESAGLTPEQIVQALTAAYRADAWVGVDWADDNGATHSNTMRVLSMGSGVVNLVRRAAGRLRLPLTRIIAVDAPTGATESSETSADTSPTS